VIYRVLVTDSRSWTNVSAIEYALVDVWHDATQLGGSITVVHGACYPPKNRAGKRPIKSADFIAALCCAAYDIPMEAHPAAWGDCTSMCPNRPHVRTRADGTPYCPLAGHARNQSMVDAGAHLVLAFPAGAATGTRDCMRRAAAAGIEVVEVAG
jgi:hypothetical protein